MNAAVRLSHRLLGPLLVVGAAVLAAATPASPARAAEPDYSGYQALLRRYLHVVQPKGKPFDTRFDYEQLYIDENIWNRHRAEGLETLKTQLLSVSPADMSPRERKAWAINAYNFLVIERMTLNLLVPGRKFMRYDSPRQVNVSEGTFFAAPVTTIDGVEYSLTGFERRFLYDDTTAIALASDNEPRTKSGDPRLQCALVRGALCSGPLSPFVYRADSLEAQLDRAARLALALPTWLRADPATGQLSATNRFFEERVDFGGPDLPGLVPFLLKYAPLTARKVITAHKLPRPNLFFEPDWKLNQFDHPRPALPGADSTGTKSKG